MHDDKFLPCQDQRRSIAASLFQQSEQCALNGFFPQAEALLAQVWELTLQGAAEADLANHSAWNMAWLLVRRGAYKQATIWFERVKALPTHQSRFWPVVVPMLSRLCAVAEQSLLDSAITPDPAAFSPQTCSGLVPLQINCLGRFELIQGQTVLPQCKARKSSAILRYLLMRPQYTATKDELIEVLWPKIPSNKAIHNLHVAISMLRRYLNDNSSTRYIVCNHGSYSLNSDALLKHDCALFMQWTDTAEAYCRSGDFTQAEQFFQQAIDLYQADFYVDDCDGIWAITERERFLARYLKTLEHLGDIRMLLGRFLAAIECYQRIIERDSYREDVHGQIMRCYWRLGRRAESLRQYQHCRRLLLDDLGLEPSQDLQLLRASLVSAGIDSAVLAHTLED